METLVIAGRGKHGGALVNLLFKNPDSVQVYASDGWIISAIGAVSHASGKFGEMHLGRLSYGNVEIGMDNGVPYLRYCCGFPSDDHDGYKAVRPINKEEWRKSALVGQKPPSLNYLFKRMREKRHGELYIAGLGRNVPNVIEASHYFRQAYDADVEDVEMGVTGNIGDISTVAAGIRIKMKQSR